MTDDTDDTDDTTAEKLAPSAELRAAAQRLTTDIVKSGLSEKGDADDIMTLLEMAMFGVISSCVQCQYRDTVLGIVTESVRENLAIHRLHKEALN